MAWQNPWHNTMAPSFAAPLAASQRAGQDIVSAFDPLLKLSQQQQELGAQQGKAMAEGNTAMLNQLLSKAPTEEALQGMDVDTLVKSIAGTGPINRDAVDKEYDYMRDWLHKGEFNDEQLAAQRARTAQAGRATQNGQYQDAARSQIIKAMDRAGSQGFNWVKDRDGNVVPDYNGDITPTSIKESVNNLSDRFGYNLKDAKEYDSLSGVGDGSYKEAVKEKGFDITDPEVKDKVDYVQRKISTNKTRATDNLNSTAKRSLGYDPQVAQLFSGSKKINGNVQDATLKVLKEAYPDLTDEALSSEFGSYVQEVGKKFADNNVPLTPEALKYIAADLNNGATVKNGKITGGGSGMGQMADSIIGTYRSNLKNQSKYNAALREATKPYDAWTNSLKGITDTFNKRQNHINRRIVAGDDPKNLGSLVAQTQLGAIDDLDNLNNIVDSKDPLLNNAQEQGARQHATEEVRDKRPLGSTQDRFQAVDNLYDAAKQRINGRPTTEQRQLLNTIDNLRKRARTTNGGYNMIPKLDKLIRQL